MNPPQTQEPPLSRHPNPSDRLVQHHKHRPTKEKKERKEPKETKRTPSLPLLLLLLPALLLLALVRVRRARGGRLVVVVVICDEPFSNPTFLYVRATNGGREGGECVRKKLEEP